MPTLYRDKAFAYMINPNQAANRHWPDNSMQLPPALRVYVAKLVVASTELSSID